MEKTVYIPTAEDVANGFSITQKFVITENAGKYRGKSATWTVVYYFKPLPHDVDTDNAAGEE